MRLDKSFWVKLGVESLLIVFSVLLALALNEYRTSLKEREATEQALHSIQEELKVNKAIVQDWHRIHQEVLKNVQEYRTQPERFDSLVQNGQFKFEYLLNGTLVPSVIRSTAWETTKHVGLIQHFDLTLASSLSYIYDIQRVGASSTVDKLFDLIFERQTHQQENIPQTLALFEITLEELVAQEAYLIEAYGQVLQELAPVVKE